MHDVAWIRAEGRGLRLIDLLGENRLVEAEIKDIDLVKSSIVLAGATNEMREMVPDDQDD
jgi:predicted RNA-binding protein